MHEKEFRVQYPPAESDSGMFGGNSNWRGTIWMPVNALIIRALLNYYLYYGDNFRIECPKGSGNLMNLFEVSKEITSRLTGIFLKDEKGRRPVYGGAEKFQTDPHWRDHILFYEYFHGDNWAGLGASHQTGWTGLVANLIELFGRLDAEKYLAAGKRGAFAGNQKSRCEGWEVEKFIIRTDAWMLAVYLAKAMLVPWGVGWLIGRMQSLAGGEPSLPIFLHYRAICLS